MTISDNINELIRPHTTTVKAVRWVPVPTTSNDYPDIRPGWEAIPSNITTSHEPLIDQLNDSLTASTMAGDKFSGNPKSKPPIRLDAIALIQRIDRESTMIGHRLGIETTRNLTTRLSRIAGASADLPPDAAEGIDKNTRAWVVAARVITGHDANPYQPNVPCPNVDCERRSSLRIRLEDRIGYCVACGGTWDETLITQLGIYVRWAAEHLNGARHWLTNDDGFPVECVECLSTRQEMAERSAERARQARADEKKTA